MRDGIEKMWKRAIVARYEMPSLHSCGATDGNHEKLRQQ